MKLATLVLLCIASVTLAQQRSTFDQWDKNGDGKLVPFPQSVELNKKLLAAGVKSNLITVEGGGHGSFGKAGTPIDRLVREFFSWHLKGQKSAPIEDRTLQSQ